MGWVIGGLLLVLAAVLVFVLMYRQVRAWEQRIKQEGDLLVCWVASAEKALYEVNDVPGFGNARVVFSTTRSADLKKRLKEASRRLMEGDIVSEDIDADRVEKFYSKLKEQRWLHPPIRLPKWLVGDFEAYTAMVQVYWRQLPETCLTLPYLYCRVLFGEKGGVQMVEYPEEK